MNKKPLKRHAALQNLSREHHDILIFGLRLKKGVAKKASLVVMNEYINWFWQHYLKLHFKLEEEVLFPLVKETKETELALEQHSKLIKLLVLERRTDQEIIQLYTALEKHIRFEERVFFNQVQNKLTEEQLSDFSKKHPTQLACLNWNDIFWK